MIKELMKKYFNPASAETQEEDVNLMTTETQAELTTQLASVNEALTTMQASFAELTAKYETAQAALNASEAATKLMAEQAATKRLETRTKAITEAVGTTKLEDTLELTNEMSDEKFTKFVNMMSTNLDDESKSKMFTEVGVAAESEPVETTVVSRLAAKVAEIQTK